MPSGKLILTSSDVSTFAASSLRSIFFCGECELAHEPLSHVVTPNLGSTQAFMTYHPITIARGNNRSFMVFLLFMVS